MLNARSIKRTCYVNLYMIFGDNYVAVKLYPVVMAGGSGSRLWPLSRVLYPKQFFMPERRSYHAANHHLPPERRGVRKPGGDLQMQHRFIVAEQLRQLNKRPRKIILNRRA
ncbi:sugar phosphate nucleotidyltransferase [Escherichia coli]